MATIGIELPHHPGCPYCVHIDELRVEASAGMLYSAQMGEMGLATDYAATLDAIGDVQSNRHYSLCPISHLAAAAREVFAVLYASTELGDRSSLHGRFSAMRRGAASRNLATMQRNNHFAPGSRFTDARYVNPATGIGGRFSRRTHQADN
jgi:hypothetical protein